MEDQILRKDGSRFITTENGEQFVTTTSNKQTEMWCANNWDILQRKYTALLEFIPVFPKVDDSGNVGNIKAYVGKSKINSAKKLPPVGLETRTLRLLLWHIFCYIFMPSSLS